MKPTSTSLLLRLKDPDDQAAWREFERDYRDLLLRYCRRRGLHEPDAQDVVQSLFLDLAHALPRFEFDRTRGRFRDFLFRCAHNGVARWWRRAQSDHERLDSRFDVPAAANDSDPAAAAAFEEEWVAHHYRLALRSIRLQFDARSVSMFERCIAGADVQTVAAEFGATPDAVYKLRQRIRARLEELIKEQLRAEDELDGRAP